MATEKITKFDEITKEERTMIIAALELLAASFRRETAQSKHDPEIKELRARRAAACDAIISKFRF